jgi:pyrroline-5-carboxylate reductase
MHQKFGFIGAGNMCQSLVEGWVSKGVLKPEQIFVSNRTPGKVKKLEQQFNVKGTATNEELVDAVDVVLIATKPQDLLAAIEPIASSFRDDQVVISLAAGVPLSKLKRLLPKGARIIRVIPNTPARIQKGVIGYCSNANDVVIDRFMEDLFSALGLVIRVEEGEPFEALMISCSAGVGFIFELMLYWQEWLEERGFAADQAKAMTVQTFLGASQLATTNPSQSLVDLQSKVTSKKGVTAAGLDSMRELEVERLLRYSFEKAALRDRELAQD